MKELHTLSAHLLSCVTQPCQNVRMHMKTDEAEGAPKFHPYFVSLINHL